MQSKRLKIILLIISLMLLATLIVMQFTSEVKWKPLDFVGAGILLFGTGFLCELFLRKVKKTSHRIIICASLLILLLLIWAELAVGVFGTSFGGH